MAKVRVYELARELNIDSKQLVEKLLAGGLNIKNYMSTLDETSVDRARDIVNGVVSEVVEEKRIRPTVIRRRKKIVKVEQPAEQVEPEKPAEKAEEPTEAEAAEEALREEEIAAEEAAPAPPKAKRKKAKKKKAETPARIIKRAEEGPLRDIIAKETPKDKEKRRKAAKTVEEPEPEAKQPPSITPSKSKQEAVKKKEDETPAAAKKKKGKKKIAKEEPAPRGPARRRKKAIFERADLYQDRTGRPKRKRLSDKSKEIAKKAKQTEITVPKAIKRRIKVPEYVTVADLARAMGLKAAELIKGLMKLGVMATINKSIDFETASLVAEEWGFGLELDTFEEEQVLSTAEDKPEDLQPRAPVVTIMGHVDHGKTSLLDYVRSSNIIGGESGGITQHIGAYYVKTKGGDIVFLDTPGHEAFTAMRARGAKVTDIIVLVVAADDGVMPQTREAINHARAAQIPIVVAVNKIDKAEADPEKVKRELAELELAPEEWGGETIYAYVSALSGEGIEELLDLILLQAEMLELKANPNRSAHGSIVEAQLDKSKGAVARVLISNGTLHQGDYFICGQQYGRVRAMVDQQGNKMIAAGPSQPLEVYGISGVPMAGDEFVVVEKEKTAKEVVGHRQSLEKKQELAKRGIVSLDDLFDQIKEGEVKELNVVLKSDVQGSLEALSEYLLKLSTEEVKLNIIHSATGAITESDVTLASASNGIIIGFNVRANLRVAELAEKEGIDVRYYDIIYNVVKDIRAAMTGLLEPVYREEVLGRADIREIFQIPKVGAVAGCYVTDGKVERNANIRLLRDEVVVYDGKIASLRRFKDDVKEVQAGYECGIGIEKFQDIKAGDIFEFYRMEEMEAEL